MFVPKEEPKKPSKPKKPAKPNKPRPRSLPVPVAVSSASHPGSPAAVALQPASPPIADEKSGTPSKPFYTSPWFWGAVAVAAFAGAAFYFVSRGSSDPTISLEVQVPK